LLLGVAMDSTRHTLRGIVNHEEDAVDAEASVLSVLEKV
jgi:hypothetical protein